MLPSSDSNSLICTSVVLGGSFVSLKKKELVGKVWVYETQIDNGYNKIKQPPNTGLHIAKCEVKLTTIWHL